MEDVRCRPGPDGNVLTMTKRLGKHRRRRGKGVTPRSPRFAYTLQAFGAMSFLVAVAVTAIHMRQIQAMREETISHAPRVARRVALPAADLPSRPEPMSIPQTHLHPSIRAALQ